jgi:hypothetical protein
MERRTLNSTISGIARRIRSTVWPDQDANDTMFTLVLVSLDLNIIDVVEVGHLITMETELEADRIEYFTWKTY